MWCLVSRVLVSAAEVQLIYNAVLVSGVQQIDSVIYIYILFHILFKVITLY